MSADDVKPWIDMLVTLLSAGGLGGIFLAVLGWMKAKHERPAHIAPDPSMGSGALAQLGGMVMGRQTGEEIILALNAIAASQDRCTLVREKEIRVAQELSDVRHREMRTLNDHLDTLCDRLKNLPGCGA